TMGLKLLVFQFQRGLDFLAGGNKRQRMLTGLGMRLIHRSLSDAAIQKATSATPNFAILPWANVVKIGGQSIIDRGRSAVGPVVDEIVANLHRHKMILGTGAGTRARHVYSLAIDLGLPVGVLTVLGTAVAWQNAQMLQYLLAQHGIAFLEPEGFPSLPHYLMDFFLLVGRCEEEEKKAKLGGP